MTKFWFIILSQILAACIVFYTTDNILNKRNKDQIFQPRRIFPLTKKGIALILIFLVIIGLSIWQEVDDQQERAQTRKENQAEINNRDSIANRVQNERDSLAN